MSVDSVVGAGGLGSRRKVGGILEKTRGVEFHPFMAKGSIFLPPRVAWFRMTELGTCCLGDWFLVQLDFLDFDLELGFLDGMRHWKLSIGFCPVQGLFRWIAGVLPSCGLIGA